MPLCGFVTRLKGCRSMWFCGVDVNRGEHLPAGIYVQGMVKKDVS